jgi:hypothetical protein
VSGRNLQDYIEVKDRIAEFWKQHPEGRVLTRVVEYNAERVLLFAEVYTDRADPRPAATGYAEEVRSERGVNATSAVENGETSAIGRALANMGMTLSKNRASREEMQKVERMEHSRAGAEVAPGPAQHSARPTDRPAAVPSAAGPPSSRDGDGHPLDATAFWRYAKAHGVHSADDYRERTGREWAEGSFADKLEAFRVAVEPIGANP